MDVPRISPWRTCIAAAVATTASAVVVRLSSQRTTRVEEVINIIRDDSAWAVGFRVHGRLPNVHRDRDRVWDKNTALQSARVFFFFFAFRNVTLFNIFCFGLYKKSLEGFLEAVLSPYDFFFFFGLYRTALRTGKNSLRG